MVKEKPLLIEKEDEDYEIKFWKDWLEADWPERDKLVKSLPLYDRTLEMKDIEISKKIFSSSLNNYFQDLEYAIYTKIRLENEKTNKKLKEK